MRKRRLKIGLASGGHAPRNLGDARPISTGGRPSKGSRAEPSGGQHNEASRNSLLCCTSKTPRLIAWNDARNVLRWALL